MTDHLAAGIGLDGNKGSCDCFTKAGAVYYSKSGV